MGGLLMASPATAGRDIVRGVRLGRDVIYTPGYWRPIMAVIRAIPGPVFKRLKL
jgi:decaprenylphospho-beta-D-erythro-pentofuranosid-2-ulose 2-reductase